MSQDATCIKTKIREQWQNGLKNQARLLDKELDLKNVPIIYIGYGGKVYFNMQSNDFKDILDVSVTQTKINALRKLGITFTATDYELLTNNEACKNVVEAYNGIRYAFTKGLISSVDDLFGYQIVNGRINALVALEISLRK